MRTTFVGFGAYVGRIVSRTVCEVWSADPAERGFADPLVALDLARTPVAAMSGAIEWNDVEVDDHASAGGMTAIGPLWPDGCTTGLVYLADRFLESLPVRLEPLEIDGESYERVAVIYHPGTGDPRAGRRYSGFTPPSSSGAAPERWSRSIERWPRGRHPRSSRGGSTSAMSRCATRGSAR